MKKDNESSKPQSKPRRRKRLDTPSVMAFRSFLFFSILAFAVSWCIGTVVVSRANWHGPAPDAAKASVRAIQRRLARGEADTMQKIFPEGRLFSHSFFGFSLVNMALNEPPNSAFTRMAVEEVENLLAAVESMVDQPPFDICKDMTPKGGIIIAGQANLLRAGYLLIGGGRTNIAERFHAESQIIYDAFMKCAVGSLESYPQLVWPVDNICALESLRLHDVMYGTDYAEAPKRWVKWMASHLDSESGMMVAQSSAWGGVFDDPRGCALSWSLAWMGGFGPEFAESQYALYRKNWITSVCGITGVREWWPGKEGNMDCDTGLVVGGIGMAASGFGIAATKANGDTENFHKLVRQAELLSLPAWSPGGEINYFFSKVLLADVL
ncbi:MAG: linalool dehydratase/isomerase domain-containing protein, partial [Planctomycetota bacterium]